MTFSLRDIDPDFINAINLQNAKLWENLDFSAWVSNETSFAVRKILEYSDKFGISIDWRRTPFVIKDILKSMLNSEDDTVHLLAKNIQSNRKIIKERRRNRELEQQKTDLEKLTKTDKLTWLANRACLDYEINKLIELKNRDNADFSILFIDIDKFKLINDSLWHQVWDEVLIKLSKILKENFRQNDLIWRRWWDEIMITLPFTWIINAAHKADQLRNIVEKAFSSDEKLKGLKITISIWVAQIEELTDTSEILMAKADTALYKCKDDWRNAIRIQLYKPNEICNNRTCEECEYNKNCIKKKTT